MNPLLSEETLKDILKSVGIILCYDTHKDWIGYCVFHNNRDSPAFNISKESPFLWRCQNASCAQTGNIFSLLTKCGYSKGESKRLLLHGSYEIDELVAIVDKLMYESETQNQWANEDPLLFHLEDQQNGLAAKEYVLGRGVSAEAYEYFKMGYSKKQNRLVVPIFDDHNVWVGVVGRSLAEKSYRYSDGTPRSSCIWNVNNCKEQTELILCEGVLDAVAIWDAGIHNVGAVFGSAISEGQWRVLRKYFDSLVLWFDNDQVGNSLRDAIIECSKDLLCYTVQYPEGPGIKDPGDLAHEVIRYMYEHRQLALSL